LDLSKTELVVLSACETGLGDIQGSEGVYGLQRGFKSAGVKNMIITLWQIPDKESSEFMGMFYTKWLKDKKDISAAFLKPKNISALYTLKMPVNGRHLFWCNKDLKMSIYQINNCPNSTGSHF
jgi:hypothetical protein